MSEQTVRRSARSTKGQNSRLEDERKIEEELIKAANANKRKSPTPKPQSSNKKVKSESSSKQESQDQSLIDSKVSGFEGEEEDDDDDDVGEEDEELIRCLPCGATTENYDEDTDKGGFMILCDTCETWQHGKCMGFANKKNTPKKYSCNVCSPQSYPNLKSLKQENDIKKDEIKDTTDSKQDNPIEDKKIPVPEKISYSINSLKDKSRQVVAKLFKSKFDEGIPEDLVLEDDLGKDVLTIKWALELENEVHKCFPEKKKYNDKARSLSVNLIKYNLIGRFIKGELSFNKIVNLTPEEMNTDLQAFAENVRKESIRQSVLKAEEQPRIRRTHKGEEVVENTNEFNNNNDDTILHTVVGDRSPNSNGSARESEDEKSSPSEEGTSGESETEADNEIKETNKHTSSFNTALFNRHQNHMIHDDHHDDFSTEHMTPENSQQPTADLDDDLDLILNSNQVTPGPSSVPSIPQEKSEERNPQSSDHKIWDVEMTFPGLTDFEGYGVLSGSTSDACKTSLHSLAKKLVKSKFIEIEGRLDIHKANSYLSKIATTRDLFLVEIKASPKYEDETNFIRLFNYFAEKKKYGVVTDRPLFVKDCYLVPISKDQELPDFFHFLNVLGENTFNDKDRLFCLFVVKKEVEFEHPPKDQPKVNVESFLNNLQSQFQSGHQPVPQPQLQPQTQLNNGGMPANISANDLAILQMLVQQHPEASQNPALLFELLKQQHQYENL